MITWALKTIECYTNKIVFEIGRQCNLDTIIVKDIIDIV